MKSKSEWRKQMASLKRAHAQQLDELSKQVLASLEANTAFQQAHTVLLYHSLKDEVNTHVFVDKWCKDKKVLLPVVIGDDLELRLYRQASDLQTGAYGILEPVGEAFTQYDEIEFVAVPGVAFDQQGNRLGRGKGYYDRLLPRLNQAFKAGICFPFQWVEELPTDFHDIQMDTIITCHENELSHPHHPLPTCDRE